MEIRKKYILYLIISIIAVMILVNVNSPIKNFVTDNDWIAFYGNILGGIIGGLFALLIAKTQIEQNERKTIEQDKVIKNYLLSAYLMDIKVVLNELRKKLLIEIHDYDESDNKLMLVSYPIFKFPDSDYHYDIHRLKLKGLLNKEQEYKLFKIKTQLDIITEHKERNFIERDIFHNALISINTNLTSEEVETDEINNKPITLFLESITLDWRNKIFESIKIIDIILKDIDELIK